MQHSALPLCFTRHPAPAPPCGPPPPPPPPAAPTTFSNLYFVELTENKWHKKKWKGPLQVRAEEKESLLLPAGRARKRRSLLPGAVTLVLAACWGVDRGVGVVVSQCCTPVCRPRTNSLLGSSLTRLSACLRSPFYLQYEDKSGQLMMLNT